MSRPDRSLEGESRDTSMGKAAKQKKKERTLGAERTGDIPGRTGPSWPLFALAVIGAGLAGYLTLTAWSGEAVAGCPAGSGCDIVLGSRWATLFGQPTSFWGLLAYVGLAGIAWLRNPELRWKLAWIVALFGALFSLYLTIISIAVIAATCPYCLTSAALMLSIIGLLVYLRPGALSGIRWRTWILKTAAPSLALVLALHFGYFAGGPDAVAEAEDPYLQRLATHLTESGAIFYGAFWCPHCQEQKALFGASAHRLPYLECSPSGRAGPQAQPCRQAGIQVYPTWIINGRRYEGVLTPRELAAHSRFVEGATSPQTTEPSR